MLTAEMSYEQWKKRAIKAPNCNLLVDSENLNIDGKDMWTFPELLEVKKTLPEWCHILTISDAKEMMKGYEKKAVHFMKDYNLEFKGFIEGHKMKDYNSGKPVKLQKFPARPVAYYWIDGCSEKGHQAKVLCINYKDNAVRIINTSWDYGFPTLVVDNDTPA